MKRWEASLNHFAFAGVTLSGVAYAVMKYLLAGSDPDSRLGHPWQPQVAKLHVLFAPLAVFGLGLLFRRHAMARFFGGETEGRKTGTALLWVLLPLSATGYLVPIFSGEAAVRVTGAVHTGLGILFAAAYAFHPRGRRDHGGTGGEGREGREGREEEAGSGPS